jgi:hypothetical protein
VILGPDGIAGSMTPDAAEVSAHRLLAAAAEARNQLGGNVDMAANANEDDEREA